MNVRDWRDADAADTQLLYAREQDFWVRELAWDASNSWREIEQARTTWGLPGRIAIDHKRTVRGWSYYMPDGETLHIGGIAADTKEATTALLDACLEIAAVPPRPARVSCFVPDRADGFEAALVERGFSCEHYHYLSRTLTPRRIRDLRLRPRAGVKAICRTRPSCCAPPTVNTAGTSRRVAR